MTPKEKAKELVYGYEYLVKTWDCYHDKPLEIQYRLPDMKKCSLIVVNEILKCIDWDFYEGNDQTEFRWWNEVKKEIEKL